MTCSSCVKLVEGELKRLGAKKFSVKLGEAKITSPKNISSDKIRVALQGHGFELIENYEEIITESIRLAILELVNTPGTLEKEHYANYIEKKLDRPYKYLSKIFSKHKRENIENFFILIKIEKAKELIQYGECNFSEIAYRLGYTNPQHLSGQFRKVVGCTMSEFKENPAKGRISMNKL